MKKTALIFALCLAQLIIAQTNLRVLNFQGDNGFEHSSKQKSLELVETLGKENHWLVTSTNDSKIFNLKELLTFDVIIFNNNCGNEGRILSKSQQQAFQQYIRNGGGFVGIHCAGAIWKEEGEFQLWYEKLVGTKLIDHPKVQEAILIVENQSDISTKHLPKEWTVTDEWHRFSYNPREGLNVLISVDEDSYSGEQKMQGDHPFTWYQYFDGGRSFFTSLGHTEAIYDDTNFKNLIEGSILWASNFENVKKEIPIKDGLLLDLDADYGISVSTENRIDSWRNQVNNSEVKTFDKRDKGREIAGSGRPRLRLNVSHLNGHNSVVFHRQELLNDNEDAFDHLITGSGYTWFSVMSAYEQVPDLPGVNSFFGNLRNNNGDEGKYEGLWAGLTDDNRIWTGARNAITFGRWDENNPQLIATKSLENTIYYLVMGRMDAGIGKVKMALFINESTPDITTVFPVNPKANASKMAIGQERDAIEHPGKESFDGEIARFLIFERPLTDSEMMEVIKHLKQKYNLN